MAKQGPNNNVTATVCSVFVPGLGHLVQGRFVVGILIVVLCLAFYITWFLIIPGVLALCIHLWSIVDVIKYRHSIR